MNLDRSRTPATALVPAPPAAGTWQLRVFFDSDCPLCRREIDWLRKRIPPGRVRFVDLEAAEAAATGLGRRELMDRIHGQLAGGEIVTGMEVFRRLYAAAGLGWVLAPTAWPGLRRLADRAYDLFARKRLALTGRSECDAGTCRHAD